MGIGFAGASPSSLVVFPYPTLGDIACQEAYRYPVDNFGLAILLIYDIVFGMEIYANRYCVYRHLYRGKTFYVGMGKMPRPFDTKRRTSLWREFVKEIGGRYEVEIIKWYKNRIGARSLELKEIRKTKAPINRENRYGRYGMTGKELTKKMNIKL